MRKTFKFALIAIAALLALLIAAAAILVATFDPNDYKPQLVRLVQERHQRTLSIPGDIRLTFFPKLGVELGRLGISEHKGDAEFASVDSARLSLVLFPLLSKQLVVDQIWIEGLRANIRRFEDGRTNFDDLLPRKEQPAGPRNEAAGRQFRFDIDGVELKRAHLVFDDRRQGRKLEIADLDLKLAGNAGFMPETRRFALEGVKLEARGRRGIESRESITVKVDIPELSVTDTMVAGGGLNGEATLEAGARSVRTGFSVPSLEGTPQSFRMPAVAVEATIRQDNLDARLKLSGPVTGDIDKLLFTSPQMTLSLAGKQGDTAIDGTLTTPVTVNMETRFAELHKLTAAFNLPNPAGGTLALKAAGNLAASYGKQAASAMLSGSLDQSAFRAKLGIDGFSPLMYLFDIRIDQIDLDRYRSKAPAAEKPAAAPEGRTAPAGRPMDFAALRKLHANGSIRIGALKLADIRAADVRLDMRAADGRLDISPLSASLYGGSAAGALSIVAGNPARYTIRQILTGIDIGPLMKDAIEKDTLEGKGNLQLDVTSAGATVDRIKTGLNGTARLELRDGAIRGVNVAQVIREAKARIGEIRGEEKPQGGTGSSAQKTDFSELSGSFRIVDGVAHNEDLSIKSPLIRVAGSGDIHLAESRLDYLARTTVVSTLQGQGGPEMQALKGLTIPVRLSGPFNAINWRVDLAGMAGGLVRQRLDERKEEVREKAQEALDEQKEKIRGQLQERLKGLLGK